MASFRVTTGVIDQGMQSWGQPGNLRDPHVSLRIMEGKRRSGHNDKIPAQCGSPCRTCEFAQAKTQTQKKGKAGYRARIAKSERTRNGHVEVLAEHSTDGRTGKVDREGGEVMPKRPAAGKVKPGITDH